MGIAMYTTPTFTFDFGTTENLDLTEASSVYVTFKSKHNILTKSGSTLEVDPKQIRVHLSQTDTSIFSVGIVEIQANWVMPDGFRGASEVYEFNVDKQLLQKVIE